MAASIALAPDACSSAETTNWSGMLELHQRDVLVPGQAENCHSLSLMAGCVGIEPTPSGLEPVRPPWPTACAERGLSRPEGLENRPLTLSINLSTGFESLVREDPPFG